MRWPKIWKMAPLIIVYLASLYGASILRRAYPLYQLVKIFPSFRGTVFIPDPVLGYRVVPGARAEWLYPNGRSILLRIDERGFRIPEDNLAVATRNPGPGPTGGKILFLGDSFLFGQGVECQDTAPYLTGQIMGWESLNASSLGYSLAGILLQARELIPRYRPDVVVVQWIDELRDRAQDYFAPMVCRHVPVPFFVDGGSGIEIHPPVFAPPSRFLSYSKFTRTRVSAGDFARFFVEIALPLAMAEDPPYAGFLAKRRLGLIPSPTRNGDQATVWAYTEIADIARQNGSVLVVLSWPWIGNDIVGSNQWIPPLGEDIATIVDLFPVFCAKGEKGQFWIREGGKIIDTHPSAFVHRLVAEEIARALEKRLGRSRGPPPAGR
jgi:hypothetical protein